jgi:hypothetical protein
LNPGTQAKAIGYSPFGVLPGHLFVLRWTICHEASDHLTATVSAELPTGRNSISEYSF